MKIFSEILFEISKLVLILLALSSAQYSKVLYWILRFSNSFCVMEKTCSIACLVLGTAFLVAACVSTWCYFVPMSICYATAVLATEDREH